MDVLTSVGIQEFLKSGGRVSHFYEGVLYRKCFKASPFRKAIEKFFALRKQNKDEGNDFMQGFFKLIMNSLYGVQIREDINKF